MKSVEENHYEETHGNENEIAENDTRNVDSTDHSDSEADRSSNDVGSRNDNRNEQNEIDSDSSDNDNNQVNDNELTDHAFAAESALKNVFLSTNLKHTQQKAILGALRSYPFNHVYFPQDHRTLLQTPTFIVRIRLQEVAGGQYFHFGLRALLEQKLKNLRNDMLPEHALIDFSTEKNQ